MNRIIEYFSTSNDISYFGKLKTNFFVKLSLIGIVFLIALLFTDFIFENANFAVSFISKVFVLVSLVVFLFVLKYKGIEFTGNVFTVSTLVLLLVFINIVPEGVVPISKFIQGFYSVYAFFVLALLFAHRVVQLINAVLIIASTAHVYYMGITLFPSDSNLYTSAFINHTVVVIVISVIGYYTNKFTNNAISKANSELEKRVQKNQELMASEEEIRAANEELVATSDALVETNSELLEAKSKAEESDRLKTEFLNNMSHEVRTPMNGIIGFAQLLKVQDLDNKTQRFYTDTIQQSSNQLLSIIDNIIEISKLGTKQVKVFNEKVNINELLKELHSVFTLSVQEKNIEVELKTPWLDEQSIIDVDKIKLYKILSNLLENAIKFTEKGFVKFGYRTINSGKKNTNDRLLQFYVKDTGIGIEPEKQRLIFEKFSQAEGNLLRQYGGLGLGLSIAKENTKLLGGNICLNSERGKGSEFTITIPLIKA